MPFTEPLHPYFDLPTFIQHLEDDPDAATAELVPAAPVRELPAIDADTGEG